MNYGERLLEISTLSSGKAIELIQNISSSGSDPLNANINCLEEMFSPSIILSAFNINRETHQFYHNIFSNSCSIKASTKVEFNSSELNEQFSTSFIIEEFQFKSKQFEQFTIIKLETNFNITAKKELFTAIVRYDNFNVVPLVYEFEAHDLLKQQ